MPRWRILAWLGKCYYRARVAWPVAWLITVAWIYFSGLRLYAVLAAIILTPLLLVTLWEAVQLALKAGPVAVLFGLLGSLRRPRESLAEAALVELRRRYPYFVFAEEELRELRRLLDEDGTEKELELWYKRVMKRGRIIYRLYAEVLKTSPRRSEPCETCSTRTGTETIPENLSKPLTREELLRTYLRIILEVAEAEYEFKKQLREIINTPAGRMIAGALKSLRRFLEYEGLLA